MAITINSTPENFASMHDELYFVISSTNASTTNFKYVFDIRIGGNLISRLKVFPDPVTNKGILNVSNIIRNYWNSYFLPSTTRTLFAYNGNGNVVSYTMQFGEDLNGVVTTNMASSTKSAYNFAPPAFRDYSTSYFSQWFGQYLTNRDLLQLTINGDEKLFVCFATEIPGEATLAVSVNNGTSTVTGTGVVMQSLVMFDVSPAAINAYLQQTHITDSTQSYTVTIASRTVRVTRVCTNHEKYSLHFLNELGGYDTFQFRLVNRQTRAVERKKFKRMDWALSGDVMRPYDANKRMVGGNIQYAVMQDVNYRLTSDWVNAKDYTWLRELITSPEVYFETGGYYYPAIITMNNWEQKIRQVDKNFNLEIGVELLNTNSQFR